MGGGGFLRPTLDCWPDRLHGRHWLALPQRLPCGAGEGLGMLWLKCLLAYCVLVAFGLWFGYRSQKVLPSGTSAGDDAVVPSNDK